MRRFPLLLLAVLVLSLGSAVRPQEQPPPVTFKVDVNYVEVGAVVTDAQGRFVESLGKDDFQILEDGRPQKVAGFSLVDIPVRRTVQPSGPVPERDVSSNAGGLQGRLYLL